MKINKKQIEQLISKLVKDDKSLIINELMKSGVKVDRGIGNKSLELLTLLELERGNEELITNLGLLLDDIFNLESYSNGSGYIPPNQEGNGGLAIPQGGFQGVQDQPKPKTWFGKNKDKIFSTGIDILSNIFSHKKNDTNPIVSYQPNGNNSDVNNYDGNNKPTPDHTLKYIGIGVGSLVVIGLIIFIVKQSRN